MELMKTCMNESCRVTMSSEWKNGWELRSGGFARLCVSCGIEYERSTFCYTFHKSEDGWRNCRNCGKYVHCGCSASKMQFEILDTSGVICTKCINLTDTQVTTVPRNTSQTQHHRYMPRTSRQELQQISQNLQSAIVPLFEKVLSASDLGKMDRIVLPKSCAEEYFPPIDYSEGLPIRILDVKGKKWKFQYRFWINNSSRMYVLERVTPFLNAMQLQAGDAVTFSRKDPSYELVIGFRKIGCPMKPSGSSSLPPDETTPKGQATLNEDSRGFDRGNMDCTKIIELEPSGLDILATTALLAENIDVDIHCVK